MGLMPPRGARAEGNAIEVSAAVTRTISSRRGGRLDPTGFIARIQSSNPILDEAVQAVPMSEERRVTFESGFKTKRSPLLG